MEGRLTLAAGNGEQWGGGLKKPKELVAKRERFLRFLMTEARRQELLLKLLMRVLLKYRGGKVFHFNQALTGIGP